ncbi:MAG: preprotein translocase subunit SecA, partial [Pirellulaceae bacterium]|nr:preprotein translocase subunit SecA [Pirellulaceae bacterium]
EAGKRYLNMRHYDCQITGGAVLHEGSIAEMITGEGKTLVATLPAYLNALSGQGVHVITVNDYLARRDMEWMAPLYMGLGLTVGAIQSDMEVRKRQAAYACDITYGTNNEFGFDYLRDNMRPAAQGDDRYPKHQQQSQGRLNFAIIDEVDNILVDEARTPLIISGPAHENIRKYADADRIARQLKKEEHFVVNEKDHSANLTDEGIRAAEKLAGVESFYTAGNMEWPHLLDNSLKAHYLYKRDVNYVVKESRVIIVDEFTGRLMEGRQWSDGLHQAVEAKEGVKIKEETQTLATITLQNFFKLYKKIAGMTGTAMTEANEFLKIYGLNVVAIEPNRELQRIEHPDVIYQSEREKFIAVADDIEQVYKWDIITLKSGDELYGKISKENSDNVYIVPHESKQTEVIPKANIAMISERGRPVLVGTVSIEKSERIGSLLEQRGIPHEVLNAKHHKREADIVSQAGRSGAVTIATNMAGRGTDIVLGGNPETMAWARLQDRYETRLDVPHEEWTGLVKEIEDAENMVTDAEHVKRIGGLHVIGTERHDARRIDLQLRGRCGRQGDPGDSRFFLSLEDDLMRIFAGPWVKGLLARLGMKEGERIESKIVTRRIEGAQKKVEERNFEIRKNLLEYDEVMDEQRKRVYTYRQQILDGANCRSLILDSIRNQVDHYLDIFLHRNYSSESFAEWASSRFSTPFESRDFQGMTFKDAELFVRDHAERMVETQVLDAIEENLPAEQEDEWNWEALTKMA